MEEYIVKDGNVYRKIDAEGMVRDIDSKVAALLAQRAAIIPKVEEATAKQEN